MVSERRAQISVRIFHFRLMEFPLCQQKSTIYITTIQVCVFSFLKYLWKKEVSSQSGSRQAAQSAKISFLRFYLSFLCESLQVT